MERGSSYWRMAMGKGGIKGNIRKEEGREGKLVKKKREERGLREGERLE